MAPMNRSVGERRRPCGFGQSTVTSSRGDGPVIFNCRKNFISGRRSTRQQQGKAYRYHGMTHPAQTVGWEPRGTTEGQAPCEAGGNTL